MRANPYTKTLLAIRNKTTNQIRLVETNCVTLSAQIRHPKTANPFLVFSSHNFILPSIYQLILNTAFYLANILTY